MSTCLRRMMSLAWWCDGVFVVVVVVFTSSLCAASRSIRHHYAHTVDAIVS